MRKILHFIVLNFLLINSTLAGDQPLLRFPILGFVQGNFLHVPIYRKISGKLPELLFAYGSGKEYISKLRVKDSYVPIAKEPGHSCQDSIIGYLVYETKTSHDRIKVIIFDQKKEIKFNRGKIIESASKTEWEIFSLTSNEGIHDIVRIKQNGICINHIDYYTHCYYDTEADSKEKFTAAMCGKAIDGDSTIY